MTTPLPLTGENDRGVVYRRKRMPARRRKNWVRFKRKVQSVVLGATAKKYAVLRRPFTILSAANFQNSVQYHTAMGLNGEVDTFNDVSVLFDAAVTENLVDAGLKASGKLHISGWMVETQVVNESVTTAYVDMYYWRCKKNVPSTLGGINQILEEGFADMGTLGAVPVARETYGVTPFQCNQFTNYIRVWKKVRVKLAAGGVTQVETRSGKNYRKTWGIAEDLAMDRDTEGIYMMFYGTPGVVNQTAEPIRLRFVTNKTYTISWFKDSEFEVGVL